jgi:hypothetical protein
LSAYGVETLSYGPLCHLWKNFLAASSRGLADTTRIDLSGSAIACEGRGIACSRRRRILIAVLHNQVKTSLIPYKVSVGGDKQQLSAYHIPTT